MEVDALTWTRLLAKQDLVVSRAQALAAGWTRDAIRHRLTRGHWQVLVPGVVLTVSGTPTHRQRLRGALLHAGPAAALSAATACSWHGLECVGETRFVHVAVPATVRRRSCGYVRVHPTTRPTRPLLVNGLPAVPVARAVVDAALALRSPNDVRALCAEAVQRRRVRVDELAAELVGAPSAGSAVLRRVLGEVADGARSAPEAVLLAALRRRRNLPPYLLNVDVHDRNGRWLGRPDVLFEVARLIVEVDGWRWHRDPQRQRADVERQTRLEAAGWTVLRYPAAAVLADPDAVVRQIVEVLRSRTAA